MGQSAYRFESRIVVVTGAASGIGYGIAEGFCREHATVVGCDVDRQRLDDCAAALTGSGGRFLPMHLDVSEPEQVVPALERISEDVGDIDILVNNAGINMDKTFSSLEIGDWDHVMDTNLRSVYLMCKSVWAGFVSRHFGVIVNVSSVMGQVGGAGASAYCSTKSAILMLSRCLAKEGAPFGIRVNCVCPGYIDTPILDRYLQTQADPEAERRRILALQPMGRLGTPADVAQGVMFLASLEAGFVSGVALTIDGALTSTQVD